MQVRAGRSLPQETPQNQMRSALDQVRGIQPRLEVEESDSLANLFARCCTPSVSDESRRAIYQKGCVALTAANALPPSFSNILQQGASLGSEQFRELATHLAEMLHMEEA